MTGREYYRDEQVTLLLGDTLDVLRGLPDESVDCIVTSPPYYGLRDYGIEGQYGLEPTPAAYVETMRAVFAEARRVLVLAKDGTCWVNLGDSYSGGNRATYHTDSETKTVRSKGKTAPHALTAALRAAATPTRPGAPLRLNAENLAAAFGITIPPHAADVPAHLVQLIPLLAAGLHRDQIAARLGITPAAAGSRISRLYQRLGAHSRVQAVRTAHEIGLLPTIPGDR